MRRYAEFGASLVVIAVFFPFGAAQSGSHPPTPEESISIKTAGGPKISPDGKYVVYGVREADWKQNEYVSHLWLADTATGRTFRLTRGSKSSHGADWSPDARWIAFITEREAGANPEPPAKPDQAKKEDQKKEEKPAEGKPAAHQIWVISPVGGEAWQLTKHETDLGALNGPRTAGISPSPPRRPKRKPPRTEKRSTAATNRLKKTTRRTNFGSWTLPQPKNQKRL